MSKDWTVIIFGIFVITLFIGLFVAFGFYLNDQTTTVIAEGVVMDFKFSAGWKDHFQVLLDDGKWYKIVEKAYNLLNLGDFVQIFKNGAVVVIA